MKLVVTDILPITSSCTACAFTVFRQTPALHVGDKFSFSAAESVKLHPLFPREVASRSLVRPLLDDVA